jgi:hypothetical protein
VNTAYQLPLSAARRAEARVEHRFYYLDPPLAYTPDTYGVTDEPAAPVVVPLVIVSTSDLMRPETFIFAADAQGALTSFEELPGSLYDRMDHEAALRSAGYDRVITSFADPSNRDLASRVVQAIVAGGGLAAVTAHIKEIAQ